MLAHNMHNHISKRSSPSSKKVSRGNRWTPFSPLFALRLQAKHQIPLTMVGVQVVLAVKNLPADAGDTGDCRVDPWVGKIPWRWKWQPAPAFSPGLPGESHGHRNLEGHSPWGAKGLTSWSGLAGTRALCFQLRVPCRGFILISQRFSQNL